MITTTDTFEFDTQPNQFSMQPDQLTSDGMERPTQTTADTSTGSDLIDRNIQRGSGSELDADAADGILARTADGCGGLGFDEKDTSGHIDDGWAILG